MWFGHTSCCISNNLLDWKCCISWWYQSHDDPFPSSNCIDRPFWGVSSHEIWAFSFLITNYIINYFIFLSQFIIILLEVPILVRGGMYIFSIWKTSYKDSFSNYICESIDKSSYLFWFIFLSAMVLRSSYSTRNYFNLFLIYNITYKETSRSLIFSLLGFFSLIGVRSVFGFFLVNMLPLSMNSTLCGVWSESFFMWCSCCLMMKRWFFIFFIEACCFIIKY